MSLVNDPLGACIPVTVKFSYGLLWSPENVVTTLKLYSVPGVREENEWETLPVVLGESWKAVPFTLYSQSWLTVCHCRVTLVAERLVTLTEVTGGGTENTNARERFKLNVWKAFWEIFKYKPRYYEVYQRVRGPGHYW